MNYKPYTDHHSSNITACNVLNHLLKHVMQQAAIQTDKSNYAALTMSAVKHSIMILQCKQDDITLFFFSILSVSHNTLKFCSCCMTVSNLFSKRYLGSIKFICKYSKLQTFRTYSLPSKDHWYPLDCFMDNNSLYDFYVH